MQVIRCSLGVISQAVTGVVLPSVLFLCAMNVQAQDPGADAAAQAVQQGNQIAAQAAQQANQQLMDAAQQASQNAMQAAQQAQQNATTPVPQRPGYGRADKPNFSPRSGTFASATRVTIQDRTPKASIFYTLDGTEPTTSSIPYTGPVLVSSTARLKAIARSPIYSPSRVASAKYVIK